MNGKYQLWIKINVPDFDKAYGKCHEICEKMLKEFPELRLEKGFYYCSSWGKRMHWWLVDTKNNIIDPTSIQFPSKGFGMYEELAESEIPTGICADCGEYIYNGNYFCSEKCEADFLASLLR